MRRVVIAAVAVLAAAGVANANPVTFTNSPLNAGWAYTVSGQVNDSFSGVRTTLSGSSIELGMRAQQRFSATPLPFSVVNSLWGTLPMYTATTGTSTGPDNATWNFDGSVAYAGGIGALSNVSLTIDAVWGDVQELNDYSATGTQFAAFPGAQYSQNPGFIPWSDPSPLPPVLNYDFNATGLYLVTLSATDANGQTVSTQMLVNVGDVAVPTPEPVSLVVFGSLIVGATVAVWRRQAKRAA